MWVRLSDGCWARSGLSAAASGGAAAKNVVTRMRTRTAVRMRFVMGLLRRSRDIHG
ncbi:MAG: hypothetical protein MZU91_11515 [Desulfosudis oleivorans]|nr:hypothetical protein [Desulfosudis oleivorans]